MSGWIKLFRKFDQWEWYDDHNTKIVFIHLLLKANHKDKNWRGVEIKRGQFMTSNGSLSDQLGLTIKQIRRCIDNLKSTGEVGTQRAGNGALLTVCNYDNYQSLDNNIGQTKGTIQGTQKADQGQQHKNVKNDKEEKKEDIILSFSFSENILKSIEAYKDHINQLGKSHKKTEHAWKLFYGKVSGLTKKYNEAVVLDQINKAIEGNWKTLYEPNGPPSYTAVEKPLRIIKTAETAIQKMQRLSEESAR